MLSGCGEHRIYNGQMKTTSINNDNYSHKSKLPLKGLMPSKHTQPFNGPVSGTIRVSRTYRKAVMGIS